MYLKLIECTFIVKGAKIKEFGCKVDMPKNNTILLAPYNIIIVDSIIRISTTTIIDGGIRIFINETFTLNNFCIQYSNHTFIGVLEFSWSC